MTAVRIEPQPESNESAPTTRHLHLQAVRCEQFA